jgi:hypothetical protein
MRGVCKCADYVAFSDFASLALGRKSANVEDFVVSTQEIVNGKMKKKEKGASNATQQVRFETFSYVV